MRLIIGVILISLLTSCRSSLNQEGDSFKTIMIRSVGEAETLPDMASFQILLSCLDKSIASSKECLVNKSNELIELLQTQGIAKEDILTTEVNMNKSYTWRNNSNVFEGYRSSTAIFVTVRDIEKLEGLYTELLGNRNLDLSGLSYSHSKLDSLNNEAYLDALRKANNLCDKLLDELPESKKEILKIGNVEISPSFPTNKALAYENNRYEQDLEGSSNEQLSISKGTVKVSNTLFVEFHIK